jgi:hypothetical protein
MLCWLKSSKQTIKYISFLFFGTPVPPDIGLFHYKCSRSFTRLLIMEHEGITKSFRTESITKSTTRWEVIQRVIAAKLTRLTHKIKIQMQRPVPFAVLAPSGQSGNFWIHSRIGPSHVYLKWPKWWLGSIQVEVTTLTGLVSEMHPWTVSVV